MGAIEYFTRANSSKGFVDLSFTNLTNMSKVFVLKSNCQTVKTAIIKSVINEFQENHQLEIIRSPLDLDCYDGVIIKDIQVAILAYTPDEYNDDITYINLNSTINLNNIDEHTIFDMKKEIKFFNSEAYENFSEAIEIHDDWELIYINNMDFTKANALTTTVIDELLKNVDSSEITGSSYHRFFGGATYNGPIDLVEDLTCNFTNRYFIKGRPGSGKSTMLKKILSCMLNHGLDVEVYHCGFDPDSLDMLIVRKLSLCIFDSTTPHEYFPNKTTDTVIDMYSELIKKDTDEQFKEQIDLIKNTYKEKVSKGIAFLKSSKQLMEQLENICLDATNFEKVNEIKSDIINKIKSL